MSKSQITLKDRVEKEVLDEIIDNLNNGSLTSEVAQQIAKETLEAIRKIEDHEESILDFYKRLSEKHPSFEILYTKLKAEILMNREISDYKKALLAIDSGNIDQAHSIVNSAISQSTNEAFNDK